MKNNILLIFTVLTVNFSFGQENKPRIEFGKINKRGWHKEYISKNGDLIKVGDSLQIGKASNYDKFVYIVQGDLPMHADHQDKKVAIKSIEVFGRKNSGFTTYLSFKGFGLIPLYVNYEAALEVDEIKLIGAKMTKIEAINKLKEQKELLELQVITLDEYNKLKDELIPIITK